MFQNESNKLNHIMQNNLIDKQLVDTTMAQCGVSNLDDASIRDTVKIANLLEKATGEKFIRMEMGVPGLAPSRIGTEAEIEALKHGVAQFYPMLEGYPVLSEEASRFVKNFMDVDIRPEGIIPTVGAMQASYVAFMALTECHKGKDTILFIDPGFPVQKTQLEVIGKPYQTFDIYEYREEKLEAKLREYLDRGNIAGIVYSNPNNPSWVCLTDFELQVIGKLATEYDTIILEDLAYFAMDFRKDLSHPGKAPFQPTVAKYTDNYIFMISSSKLFSYAGQRLGLLCISDALFHKKYEHLKERYKADNEGRINILTDVREYGKRAEIMKTLYKNAGFKVVYDKDGHEDVADGFYFTIYYPGMTGAELAKELLYYGISSITLKGCGSTREGLRACVSQVGLDQMDTLKDRIERFAKDHTPIES